MAAGQSRQRQGEGLWQSWAKSAGAFRCALALGTQASDDSPFVPHSPGTEASQSRDGKLGICQLVLGSSRMGFSPNAYLDNFPLQPLAHPPQARRGHEKNVDRGVRPV